MGSVRYYMDEHVAGAVVRGLRSRSVDVVTVAESSTGGADDSDQLEFAFNAGRVIFTQDRDFLRLAASGIRHAGVVYAPQGIGIGTILSGLLLIHNVLSAEEMIGNVEYL
ncbi:MAG: DUF5615 family PIN-like protein [Hyphomicrobium sp.]